jgi:hypothetical protein
MVRLRGLCFFLLSVSLASRLFGQADLATVTGVVTDTGKAILPGVEVTLRNTDTNIGRVETTNGNGYFTFTEVQPGSYELRADAKTTSQIGRDGVVPLRQNLVRF